MAQHTCSACHAEPILNNVAIVKKLCIGGVSDKPLTLLAISYAAGPRLAGGPRRRTCPLFPLRASPSHFLLLSSIAAIYRLKKRKQVGIPEGVKGS